ncbi:Os09g0407600, partial [Oryza sativa Japonica Group]
YNFNCLQGFYRYWTPEVKELISELSKAEAEKEAKLKCILQNLIQLFVEHHSKWRQLVSVVAGNSSSNVILFL